MSMTLPGFHSGKIHGIAGNAAPVQIGRRSIEELIAKYEREGVRGHQSTGSKPELTGAQKSEARRLRAAGMKLADIGARLDRDATTISKACAGVRPARPVKFATRRHFGKPVESDNDWWPNSVEASKATGVSQSGVRNACNGWGEPTLKGVTFRFSKYKTRAGWERNRQHATRDSFTAAVRSVA